MEKISIHMIVIVMIQNDVQLLTYNVYHNHIIMGSIMFLVKINSLISIIIEEYEIVNMFFVLIRSFSMIYRKVCRKDKYPPRTTRDRNLKRFVWEIGSGGSTFLWTRIPIFSTHMNQWNINLSVTVRKKST